jgi:hypothetical protein
MSEPSDRDKPVRQSIEEAFVAREEDQRFERALGRFMIAWADTEAELYRVLVQYTQVSDPVARALFSGTRAKAMMDFIKSIAHNTAMASDRREDIDYAFSQLSAINAMRDHLVHHASDNYSFDDPKKRIVANTRASRYGNAKGYEISVETIDAMTWDLYGIANHLNMHWGPREGPFRPWRENHDDDASTPWTYKPPQPIASWEENPSSPRTRTGPQKPSPD